MTEDRVYRKALGKEEAIKEIEKNASKQFDPQIARLFVNLIKAGKDFWPTKVYEKQT